MSSRRSLLFSAFLCFHASAAASLCAALQWNAALKEPMEASWAGLLILGIGIPLTISSLVAPFSAVVLRRLLSRVGSRVPQFLVFLFLFAIAVLATLVTGLASSADLVDSSLTRWLGGWMILTTSTSASALLLFLGNASPHLSSRFLSGAFLIGSFLGIIITGFTHDLGSLAPVLVFLGLSLVGLWIGRREIVEGMDATLVHTVARSERLSDCLRSLPSARSSLLLFSAYLALLAGTLCVLPRIWLNQGGAPQGELPPPAFLLATLLIGSVIGLLGGGILCRRSRLSARWITFAFLLGSPVATLAAALEPSYAGGLFVVCGIPAGLLARLHRQVLFNSLAARGIRLPRELETTILASLGAGFSLIGGLVMVVEQWSPVIWIAGALLAVGHLAYVTLWWKLYASPSEEDSRPMEFPWVPGIALQEERQRAGDARSVTVLYEVPVENRSAFQDATGDLRRVRKLEGALQWRLTRDPERPERFRESYLLESWTDYQEVLRHETDADREIKQRVFNLNDWDSLPLETHEALEET